VGGTKIIEFGLCDGIVDVDSGNLQGALLQHTVEMMDTGRSLFRDTLDSSAEFRILVVDKSSKITTCPSELIIASVIPSSKIMLGACPSLKLFKLCSMHQIYSSSVSPFHANTGTPVAAIAAAAES
jgi:hypothetical protein